MSRNCRICAYDRKHRQHIAREMIYGTREEFTYFECGGCGCLQLADVPADMSRYYPADYYSFQQERLHPGEPAAMSLLRTMRDRYLLYGTGMAGGLLQTVRPAEFPFALLKPLGDVTKLRILDVGCGGGAFLQRLQQLGVRHTLGIDPYINESITYPNGLQIIKTTLDSLDRHTGGLFDVILFNHSFEHMADPYQVLRDAFRFLAGTGRIIIHLPVVSSHAWDHYGVDWVQLDAPRHLHLFSPVAMKILTRQSGYALETITYTSNAFQFWGSELYRRNCAMPEWGAVNCRFSRSEMWRFRMTAHRLNRECYGDQAAFYLRKI